MKKDRLKRAVADKIAEDNKVYAETKAALQTVYDALNKGQRKKLEKDAEVKALLERYGIGESA